MRAFHLAVATLLSATSSVATPIAADPVPTEPPVVYKTAFDQPAVTSTVLSVASGAAKVKRGDDACVPQPTGIAYKSTPDDAATFSKDPYYALQANAALTPAGYNALAVNLNASLQANKYMGFTLLDTYDVQSCASRCKSIDGCVSFNIYFERDPSVDPNPDSCPNPPSVTNIKCVWWGEAVTTSQATNYGQYRASFQVVIAGSNIYNTAPVQRSFRIKTGGSGTVMDGRWLAVSPGEGAAVALNPQAYKGQTSTFTLGDNGTLVQTYWAKGMAGVAPNKNGIWDFLQYRAVGQAKADYIKCSVDSNSGMISCYSKSGWQWAGVCPQRKQSISGLLYFGLAEKMPSDCKWIGLYVDYDISGLA